MRRAPAWPHERSRRSGLGRAVVPIASSHESCARRHGRAAARIGFGLGDVDILIELPPGDFPRAGALGEATRHPPQALLSCYPLGFDAEWNLYVGGKNSSDGDKESAAIVSQTDLRMALNGDVVIKPDIPKTRSGPAQNNDLWFVSANLVRREIYLKDHGQTVARTHQQNIVVHAFPANVHPVEGRPSRIGHSSLTLDQNTDTKFTPVTRSLRVWWQSRCLCLSPSGCTRSPSSALASPSKRCAPA
ncbi:hypothetical protein A7982_13778 [Minicystis rosea]|nr:hypothetical protein A7982_13778 [Minicystis rosea]